MKTIKGFENEEIEVSDFGEWIGKDYIDYKSEYKSNQKLIKILLQENQELKAELQLYQGVLKREHEAIHRVNDLEEVIDKLKEDLNLLIEYGDGEDASKYDKQYGEFAKNHLKYMDKLLKEVE